MLNMTKTAKEIKRERTLSLKKNTLSKERAMTPMRITNNLFPQESRDFLLVHAKNAMDPKTIAVPAAAINIKSPAPVAT